MNPWLDALLDLDRPMQEHRLAELREHDAALANELESMLMASRHARDLRFLDGPG